VSTRTLVTLFKTAAIAEAVSWAGLLIGMFFKRVLDVGELGVQIFGPIHGAMFLLYVLSVLLVRGPLGWNLGRTMVGLLAAIPPFATIWFERRVLRTAPAEASRESAPAGV
jgi:integral membrane protein